MRYIYMISGFAKSGKDVLADYLTSKHFKKFAFANSLKLLAAKNINLIMNLLLLRKEKNISIMVNLLDSI